jgi:hypothetical protein
VMSKAWRFVTNSAASICIKRIIFCGHDIDKLHS